MRPWMCFVSCLIVAAPLVAAPEARGADVRVEARIKGESALKLFKASQWNEAYEAFKEAESLYHAPTLVLYMAHCRRNIGRLLAARDLYQKVATEALPADASDAFRKAQAAAQEELDKVDKRIPRLKVAFGSSPPSPVQIDGQIVAAATLSAGYPVDPGEHTVMIERPGEEPFRKSVVVAEGENVEIAAPLGSGPGAGSGFPGSLRSSLVPAGIALGVGAVGLGVGAVVGSIAMDQVNDIKSRCTPDGHCPAADKSRADSTQALITTSTVGLVLGSIGVAAGATLLVWRATRSTAPNEKKTALDLGVGIGSVVLSGSF